MVRQVRDFTIVHATLDTPHKWGYVFNQLDAAASFNYQHTQLCFYGHTHAPRAYIRDGSVKSQLLDKLQHRAGQKVFHQCGSVGQPRDGDWHAAYCPLHARTSSSSNCAASNTTSGPRRTRSSPPACRSGSRIGWRWENSARMRASNGLLSGAQSKDIAGALHDRCTIAPCPRNPRHQAEFAR